MEDLEDQKRKKKKEKMTLGSLSRVFTRNKQRKSLDPGLFDGTTTPDYYIEEDADWWCVRVCVQSIVCVEAGGKYEKKKPKGDCYSQMYSMTLKMYVCKLDIYL